MKTHIVKMQNLFCMAKGWTDVSQHFNEEEKEQASRIKYKTSALWDKYASQHLQVASEFKAIVNLTICVIKET